MYHVLFFQPLSLSLFLSLNLYALWYLDTWKLEVLQINGEVIVLFFFFTYRTYGMDLDWSISILCYRCTDGQLVLRYDTSITIYYFLNDHVVPTHSWYHLTYPTSLVTQLVIKQSNVHGKVDVDFVLRFGGWQGEVRRRQNEM